MDALIAPSTRDYVLLLGAAQRDPADGLANAIYLRLITPLGSYFADSTLGSRLHELQREKDKARVAILAAQYADQALAPILSDGRATQINVTTERASGRLNLLVEAHAASGQTFTFLHQVAIE